MSRKSERNMAILWLTLAVVMSLALLAWACGAKAADINLTWDASTGASSYKVQVSTDGGKTWGETREAGAEVKFVWKEAPDSGLVMFRPIACNTVDCAVNYRAGAWYCGDCLPPGVASGLGVK